MKKQEADVSFKYELDQKIMLIQEKKRKYTEMLSGVGFNDGLKLGR